jgi:hypothetical protein
MKTEKEKTLIVEQNEKSYRNVSRPSTYQRASIFVRIGAYGVNGVTFTGNSKFMDEEKVNEKRLHVQSSTFRHF